MILPSNWVLFMDNCWVACVFHKERSNFIYNNNIYLDGIIF